MNIYFRISLVNHKKLRTNLHLFILMFPKNLLINVKKVKYPVVQLALAQTKCDQTEEDSRANLIWWDGYISTDEFLNFYSYQKVNKIPAMDVMCYKNNFFQSLQKMQSLYPSFYSFFATTFQIPFQYSDFQREHNRQSGRATWIFKPRSGCCGNGIKLIQNCFDLARETRPAIIQRYINPYLINGYKFDFRLYILCSKISPFTVYLYKEGLARFCSVPYEPPNISNLDNKMCHLTNTAVNIKNDKFGDQNKNNKTIGNENEDNDDSKDIGILKLASEVLKSMENGNQIWYRISQIVALTMIALLPQILHNISLFSLDNSNSHKYVKMLTPKLEPYDRYFHILGIDILINDKMEPIVLELNDRPSMCVSYPIEEKLKSNLVLDALKTVYTNKTGGWQQVLPANENRPFGKALVQIQQQAIKDTKISSSSNKPIKMKRYVPLRGPRKGGLPPLSKSHQ
ncbi:Tubulin-tyrosine ligase family protein [Tritrichomonas foetus]|uniref:Tubulin-tyrosine ligase family protein n=1 Tax=Tritrichomonas foetus TaxID=1144522 RepID=A0A1J4KJ10_9EUKA|nr:Tubulin-tyrosine ligase family protein [Tritrichomonas foetus]|eukprot:OHT09670.1 Tubulin-tyrosine ligase family protein [Tritrichomonas foetus]